MCIRDRSEYRKTFYNRAKNVCSEVTRIRATLIVQDLVGGHISFFIEDIDCSSEVSCSEAIYKEVTETINAHIESCLQDESAEFTVDLDEIASKHYARSNGTCSAVGDC